MGQQVLLNLVHQPSDCSDFSGRLQAKAQTDMKGNLVQLPRGTLRPTLQALGRRVSQQRLCQNLAGPARDQRFLESQGRERF